MAQTHVPWHSGVMQVKPDGDRYMIKVQCEVLGEVLAREGISHIDILSIDIEGPSSAKDIAGEMWLGGCWGTALGGGSVFCAGAASPPPLSLALVLPAVWDALLPSLPACSPLPLRPSRILRIPHRVLTLQRVLRHG